MNKNIMLVGALLTALPCIAAAVVECRSYVCTDIRGLNDIAIAPTENDLFGSTKHTVTTTEEFCAISYSQSNPAQTVPYDVQFSTRTGTTYLGSGLFEVGAGQFLP